ncbi:MAG TPA: hypothetical protein VJ302_10150 [Blastocatellia bacterium]|nr:hypothetical protein [Blastocatellia bacterium]
MITIIFITILLVAATIMALSRGTRRPPTDQRPDRFEPRAFEGLFAEEREEAAREQAEAETRLQTGHAIQLLLGRAAEGEVTVLDDAHERRDVEFYRQILQTLITQSGGRPEALRAVAAYIVGSRRLRSTPEFARTMIEVYGQSLDRSSLVEMVHLSGLSDDPATFEQAVDLAFARWREGKLPEVSAADLRTVVESAYWLLTDEVRFSGSGFLVKRVIANLRRELAAAS